MLEVNLKFCRHANAGLGVEAQLERHGGILSLPTMQLEPQPESTYQESTRFPP